VLAGEEAQEKLARCIGACKLVVLDVSQNQLVRHTTVQPYGQSASSACWTLSCHNFVVAYCRKLKASSSCFCLQGDSFVLILSEQVSGGDSLTVLDLSENAITDDGLTMLAGVLEVDGELVASSTTLASAATVVAGALRQQQGMYL
jgi:hypothetical protein